MGTKIVVDGKSVELGMTQQDIDASVDAKIGDLNAILDAINNGSSPANLRDITVVVDPEEAGTAVGGGYATDGVTMALSANLAEGYKIDHWEKNNQVITASDRYDMTVDGNAVVTAVATQKEYVLGRDWRLISLGDGSKRYDCRRIAYGNGIYVMTVYNSDICLYSKDGINWTERSLTITGGWFSVIYVNGVFIMTNHSSGGLWLKSFNGLSWTTVASPTGTSYSTVYEHNGTAYFMPTAANVDKALTTSDGITWREITLPSSVGRWMSSAECNGRRICVNTTHASNPEYIYTDDGGETWHTASFPKLGNYRTIASFQNKFIVFLFDGGSAMVSEDGLTWSDIELPMSLGIGIAVSCNGTLTVIPNAINNAQLYKTADLENWTRYVIPNGKLPGIQYAGYAFENISMVPINENALLVSYSTDDPIPDIPTVAATNSLSLDDEEEVIE